MLNQANIAVSEDTLLSMFDVYMFIQSATRNMSANCHALLLHVDLQ